MCGCVDVIEIDGWGGGGSFAMVMSVIAYHFCNRIFSARVPNCAAANFLRSPTVSLELHLTLTFFPNRSLRITSIMDVLAKLFMIRLVLSAGVESTLIVLNFGVGGANWV